MNQPPLIGIGSQVEISGHRGIVTAIRRDGVDITLCPGTAYRRAVTVGREDIEKAVAHA